MRHQIEQGQVGRHYWVHRELEKTLPAGTTCGSGLLMQVSAQEHFKLAMIYEGPGISIGHPPACFRGSPRGFRVFRDKFARQPGLLPGRWQAR